jgi:hypothetical protein
MIEPTLKIGTTGYKLNPEKLKGAPQSVLPCRNGSSLGISKVL